MSKKIPFAAILPEPEVLYAMKYQKQRPQIPNDTPNWFSELITKCWDGEKDNRPESTYVLQAFASNGVTSNQLLNVQLEKPAKDERHHSKHYLQFSYLILLVQNSSNFKIVI